MISIEDLVVEFSGRRVLDGISLNVPAGGLTVLLGKNGSGKSVLLKTVMGLIQPGSGAVRIGDGAHSADGKEDPTVRMGYVFQKGGLFDSLTVFDNVAFPLRRQGMGEDDVLGIVTGILDRVGLAGSEIKFPSELSGGMQKRVGLARAVCINPEILLYDDPTAGLDPILSDSIAELMLDIRRNYRTTSIVATHDLKVAEKIADEIALLYGGKIVFMGTRGDFFGEGSAFARQFRTGDAEGPIDLY
ncbi:MAG TPA: ATP-binding cassette domain-containing protein [Spirochaetota bacterium]|nr:ATP-binding cassette domain-containing protein [Spirochaetota bacterium]